MSAKLAPFLQKDEIEQLQELQYALDQSALTAILHPTGLVLSTNEKLRRVAGYDATDLHRKPFHGFLSDDFRRFFIEHVLPLLNRGLSWRGELCHLARNQNPFWTEATIVPILDGNRSVEHLRFIGFEITERKVVEKALTNNSLFFTKLMDMAPIGFFMADALGGCTYINAIWTETSGCRLRCALGHGWLRSVHPEDRDWVGRAWSSFVRDGCPFSHEFRYQQPSGRTIWVLATAELVDFAPDARTRYIRVEQDLTERKENEQLINEQRAQMVAASKMSALGEMAGGIAHEINNPLAILQLRARQILQLVQPGMEQATLLRKAADNIRQTTDRIAAIIRSLRAIAREGHSDPLVITPMRELIEPTLALCHARFQSQAVTLTVHPFDPGLFVFCRAVEILQVLLNLLNNAFWAVQTLDDRWVNVSVHELNGFVDIQVMDSGMGIDPMLHDRIFLPFFTTRPIGSGTGLGLSIAKAVALDHGGDLWLDSSSAHTLFILRIPKASTEVL